MKWLQVDLPKDWGRLCWSVPSIPGSRWCCAVREIKNQRERREWKPSKVFHTDTVPVIMLWLDTETKQSGSSVVEQHHMQYTITLLKDKSKIMNRTAIFIYLKIHWNFIIINFIYIQIFINLANALSTCVSLDLTTLCMVTIYQLKLSYFLCTMINCIIW